MVTAAFDNQASPRESLRSSRNHNLTRLDSMTSNPESEHQNDLLAITGMSNETYLMIQKQYKRLTRDQRNKMKEVMTIYVHGTAYAFDPNEVIFELEMKNDTPCYEIIDEQTHCFACKEKLKKVTACEFCAMKYCPDCRLRQRAFPNSIILESGEKITGKICKICDRKFLMLDQYKNQVLPNENRDEELRHIVQAYEMRLNKAQYAITEEARITEELTQKRNEYKLQKRKIQTSSALHEESMMRGEALLRDTEREIKEQMVEMQKDRIHLDDADVEMQYLEEELINYKERMRKQLAEDKRRQELAQMTDSIIDDTATENSTVRGRGDSCYQSHSKSPNGIKP